MDDDQRCTACGAELGSVDGPVIGLIEDGALLCRGCAREAERDYDLPPLDAA